MLNGALCYYCGVGPIKGDHYAFVLEDKGNVMFGHHDCYVKIVTEIENKLKELGLNDIWLKIYPAVRIITVASTNAMPKVPESAKN